MQSIELCERARDSSSDGASDLYYNNFAAPSASPVAEYDASQFCLLP